MKSPVSLFPLLKRSLSLVLVIFMSYTSTAQNNSLIEQQGFFDTTGIISPDAAMMYEPKLYVRDIIIEGNRKTKQYIIEREMHIKSGDSIITAKLSDQIEEARKNIYNTTLFVDVKVEPEMIDANSLDIHVYVKEKWYIYPVPQFQIVDRSFHEWVRKYNASLSRVNYGIKFEDYNLTGRKDELKFYLLTGYTRNISAYYSAPYSNRQLTKGFTAGAGYLQTKEIAYITNQKNNFDFYKNGGFVKTEWYANGSYILRKEIKKREIFSAGYSHISVTDSIISKNLNPGFFNTNSTEQNIPDISYTLEYTDVNNILYPLTGFSGSFSLQKRGFGITGGINMFSAEGQVNKFISLGRKWYLSGEFMGKIKLPFNQPFINMRAMGVSDVYLRGLEYYIIDGSAYALAKANLRREILNFNIPFIKRSKIYNKIPFKIYAKAFTDVGYAYTKQTPVPMLNNKLLYSAGIGLDILTIYDLQLRFEYSINQLGEKNLVLHNKSGF